MTKWQPISTSPRDGSPFLGYLAGLQVPYFVCWWATSIKDGITPYICVLGIGELYDLVLHPTHWSPLEPPVADGEKEPPHREITNRRERVIKILWEKQFEGSPWHDKFHLIRLDSLEADYGALADKIIKAVVDGERMPQEDKK